MKKRWFILLSFVCAFAFSLAALLPQSASVRAEETDYQIVKDLSVVVFASDENKLYIDMPYTYDHGCDGLYTVADELLDVVKLNDKTFREAGATISAGGQKYRLYIGYKSALSAGDKIVIPENSTWDSAEGKGIKFGCTFTITWNGSAYSVAATAENVDKYEVDSIIIHPHSTSNSQLYMLMTTVEGNDCITGYNSWVNPDAATEKLKEQIIFNGKKMSEVKGAAIQGMDIANALCMTGYYLPEDGTIVIPEGTVFNNGKSELTFARTFTITWDGEAYIVERSSREFVFPEYEMSENMLSDFTAKSVLRLGGQSYQDAAVNNPGDSWGTNYVGAFTGRFVTEEEAPQGSLNGGYEISWEDTPGLFYTSVMFSFRDDIEYGIDDELVFNIYFSDTIDPAFTLWVTSSLNPRVWEAETMVSGLTITMGGWNEIHVSVADYVDEKGKIAPIAFTLAYGTVYTGAQMIAGGKVVFDKAEFRQVEKVLEEEYSVSDVSEIVPIGDGKTFSGDTDKEFDWAKESNISFARTDKTVDGIKAKLAVNDIERFSFYFMLNGVSTAYQDGGIYFWFASTGIRAGTAQRIFIDAPLPEELASNEYFTVEMRTIPYYIDGMKSGYYLALTVNGEEIGEGRYVSSATCNFGSWFGLFFHDFTDNVEVKVLPVNKAETSPVTLTLGTSLNATTLKVGESLGTRVKQSGKFYGESKVGYEVVSGKEYASIDEDGYINGIADGVVKVRAYITNAFGTFYSNEQEVTVGNPSVKPETPSGNKGCGSSAGAASALSLILLGAVVAIKRKK
ncbi:MAG: hypothetical protein J6N93_06905 [Clostridia bacterium]|nr:hypothetical protein [Clostridia bacterium]